LTCSSRRETIPAVLIVDAQVHIWGSGTPLPPHRPVSVFTKDELLAEMDAAGVQAAVIHPPGWDPGSDRPASTPTGSRSSASSRSTGRRAAP